MADLSTYELDPCRRELAERIHAAALSLCDGGAFSMTMDQLGRLLEKPPEAAMGDYALPCFRFAKDLKRKPAEVAESFAGALTPTGWVSGCKVHGAFLNISIDKSKLGAVVLPEVLSGKAFDRLKAASTRNKQRVMIEYSQPNTHKEFHVGHARNVCLGNSLVRLFRYTGYDVVSANYYGDDGTHIATILWYMNKNKLSPPASGKGEWLGKVYVESKRALEKASEADRAQLLAEISAVHRQIETKSGQVHELWRETRSWSLSDFRSIYEWLGVKFDVDFYESEVSDAAQKIVEEYLAKGIFKLDDGAVGVDLKEHKLGFSILRKRDGNTLYATKDLALARQKFDQFKIDRNVYVVADEQNHHFRQVFKVLELMGFKQARQCFHLSYGMVVLPEGKMSSRDGTSVSFNELRKLMSQELAEILKKYEGEWSKSEIEAAAHRLCDGAIKYGMIATDPAKEIVFDVNDWLSFDGNSGPYLMYSYARTQSILRKAEAEGLSADATQANLLTQSSEHELLRYLYDFNDTVAAACENLKPSLLATHLFYMCKSFNRFYADVPVMKAESAPLRAARLALIKGFAETLKHGLSLLGIVPPERM